MEHRILDILKVMFLAILLWFVITSWDDVINRLLFSILQLKPENLSSWVLVATIHTISTITIFLLLDVDLIETFGIHFRNKDVCNQCGKGN